MCDVSSPNVQAFLKLIRYAEHFPDESDDFYNTLYGGGRFTGYQSHPKQRVTRWGHTSDAAGAYQILGSVWQEQKDKGVVADFSPAAQDKIAFGKFTYRHALASVCAGDLASAYVALKDEWTALPGARQSRMAAADGRAAFIRFGGTPK